ncbi:MAG TPA: HlyD family efflux transporter periplasmic adaptor subunit [Cyclobacteriaceae bacterium]|nr:HlyD family efflux transporter periplasmic adaptor subunit [Cyclobacteriaceae bacterium]
MKRNIILFGIWSVVAITLWGISLHYKSEADAIVAEVDPQKIAISYERAVRIKNILVIPGQDVMKGDTLLEVERPDLLFDIEKAENELQGLLLDRKRSNEEFNNRILSTRIEQQAALFELENEITVLKNHMAANTRILENLPALGPEERSSADSIPGSSQLRVKMLENEKVNTENSYKIKIREIENEKQSEINMLNNRISILEKEISLLNSERTGLVKVSPIDGTIGNVFAQIDELISPYTTIISIYEANPTIIKAYVNEKRRQDVNVGDDVLVESSNRKYSIVGKIFEVGSRITDYPVRLSENGSLLFGQEIFISIPKENKFLGGEKVFVRLKKGDNSRD